MFGFRKCPHLLDIAMVDDNKMTKFGKGEVGGGGVQHTAFSGSSEVNVWITGISRSNWSIAQC